MEKNIKFPALREDDYWSETIDDKAVFSGFYLGYSFRISYSFKSRKFENINSEMPPYILRLLKWELYMHEQWLPEEKPPEGLTGYV